MRLKGGPVTVLGKWDKDGNRTFTATFRVIEVELGDMPDNVALCPGLPQAGDSWNVGNGNDLWVTCRQEKTIKPVVVPGPSPEWDVETTWTSGGDDKKCKDQQIDDPLLQPPQVSGSFQTYQEEATHDRFGVAITNSAWEQFRGPQVEFDRNRPSVTIEMNVASFAVVALAYALSDSLNDRELWGFLPRCVKMTPKSWSPKYYGQCSKYYTLSMDFGIRTEGWDRELLDEGTKVLNGHWDTVTGGWITDRIGGLHTPSAPTARAIAGTPGRPGTYGYVVTAYNSDGTTKHSPEVQVTLGAAFKSVQLSWPAVAGASGYTVYGRLAGGPWNTLKVVTVPSFLDDGSLTTALPAAPTEDTTGSQDANPSNPSHFIRFKDRNGENAKVILNGAGRPAQAATADGFKYFVSVVGSNLGNPLTNTSFWVQVVGSLNPLTWDNAATYDPGELVEFAGDGFTYVALRQGRGQEPDESPTYWKELPDGTTPNGDYDIATTYDAGDVVVGGNDAGKIRVERYDEANLYLLGIPVLL